MAHKGEELSLAELSRGGRSQSGDQDLAYQEAVMPSRSAEFACGKIRNMCREESETSMPGEQTATSMLSSAPKNRRARFRLKNTKSKQDPHHTQGGGQRCR